MCQENIEPILVDLGAGVQGRIHPGWAANPKQGTLIHNRQFRDAKPCAAHYSVHILVILYRVAGNLEAISRDSGH